MNLLSTDTLPPAGDIAAPPKNAGPVAGKEQSGGSGFSGMLKSSLDKAEAEVPVEETQAVDLNKVNSAGEVTPPNQVTESDVLPAGQVTTALIDLEGLASEIISGPENLADGGQLEVDTNLLSIDSEELLNDESGIGLPPVAAPAVSAMPTDTVAPVATQSATQAGLQSVSPAQVVMAQTSGTNTQADLSSGQQGNQSALQQSVNPLPVTSSDSGIEQSGVEFKLNNVTTTVNQGTGSATLNTPTVVATATGVNAASTATPLLDASSVSLQSMSLGRGESSVDVGNGLADRVQWMINHKQNVAHIRLDPPLLGKLDVQVKVMDDSATITIQTQQGMTRDMIDAASHRLREALQESGFQNVNVDVSHREDPGQTADNGSADAVMQATAEESEADEVIERMPAETWINGYRVSGMVDTFA